VLQHNCAFAEPNGLRHFVDQNGFREAGGFVLVTQAAAQVAANQANAQHSTGPKTMQGKAISARNNFKHCILISRKPLRF
jgi:hypothetical protein